MATIYDTLCEGAEPLESLLQSLQRQGYTKEDIGSALALWQQAGVLAIEGQEVRLLEWSREGAEEQLLHVMQCEGESFAH